MKPLFYLDKWWLCTWLTMCSPFLYLLYLLVENGLGADPGKYVVDYLGRWGLTALAVVLMVTPIVKLMGFRVLARHRRMIGLFCFFYLSLHFCGYLLFIADQKSWIDDLLKRPYISIGMPGYLIILALAITSNKFSVHRLKRNWKKLHRLVYLAAILGVLHYIWLTRSDYFLPVMFGVWIATLLGVRIYWLLKGKVANN